MTPFIELYQQLLSRTINPVETACKAAPTTNICYELPRQTTTQLHKYIEFLSHMTTVAYTARAADVQNRMQERRRYPVPDTPFPAETSTEQKNSLKNG